MERTPSVRRTDWEGVLARAVVDRRFCQRLLADPAHMIAAHCDLTASDRLLIDGLRNTSSLPRLAAELLRLAATVWAEPPATYYDPIPSLEWPLIDLQAPWSAHSALGRPLSLSSGVFPPASRRSALNPVGRANWIDWVGETSVYRCHRPCRPHGNAYSRKRPRGRAPCLPTCRPRRSGSPRRSACGRPSQKLLAGVQQRQ
jgi:hypothetical protein